jgi:uracil-DNA glycosylase
MRSFEEQLHPSWKASLDQSLDLLNEIERRVARTPFLPKHDLVMRALSRDIDEVKVVIFGQDPYPNPANPVGLSFSVTRETAKIPQSLRNILKELSADLGIEQPHHGDLSQWQDQGVLLLNRVLTISAVDKGSHSDLGWQRITDEVAKVLGERDVVAILWGEKASELEKYFKHVVKSAHPSPLSAYKGFLGSKPFSRANDMLIELNKSPIDWCL